MKKRMLSLAAALMMGVAALQATNVLVIHMTSGVTNRYVLLDEEPTISFAADQVVVKTTTTETSYPMEEVAYFNYENSDATGISGAAGQDGMTMNGNRLIFNGLQPGANVNIYTSLGKLAVSVTADEDGHAEVSLNSLPIGVYIVNAGGVSTKITKK